MPTFGGNFFPTEYKQFRFDEGDLLASQRKNGKFAVNKILKIDRVELKEGQSISIQGNEFVAPEDDYLLIISAAYGKSEFDSLDEARNAATSGKWVVELAHAPNRAPGAAAGQTLIGHAPVGDDELVAYHQWWEAFNLGKAGVF